jgi:hypothetical protein
MWTLIMLILSTTGEYQGYKVNKNLMFENETECVEYVENNKLQLIAQGTAVRGNTSFNYLCVDVRQEPDVAFSLGIDIEQ